MTEVNLDSCAQDGSQEGTDETGPEGPDTLALALLEQGGVSPLRGEHLGVREPIGEVGRAPDQWGPRAELCRLVWAAGQVATIRQARRQHRVVIVRVARHQFPRDDA